MQRRGGKIDDSLKDWGGFEFLVLFVWICFLVKEKVRGIVFWGPKESIVKLLRSCTHPSKVKNLPTLLSTSPHLFSSSEYERSHRLPWLRTLKVSTARLNL